MCCIMRKKANPRETVAPAISTKPTPPKEAKNAGVPPKLPNASTTTSKSVDEVVLFSAVGTISEEERRSVSAEPLVVDVEVQEILFTPPSDPSRSRNRTTPSFVMRKPVKKNVHREIKSERNRDDPNYRTLPNSACDSDWDASDFDPVKSGGSERGNKEKTRSDVPVVRKKKRK
ncbi:hypothetical protein L596_009070 [Steinernema carpocapsae]|uniref:Uncharacterized protein n=1 Tax=Steinernema carpocapsae TaxID=34508 RepID=A0A4V6A6M4_STECR|nr:hypothetical protein L596_009070 [Steinernema carpocapsae]